MELNSPLQLGTREYKNIKQYFTPFQYISLKNFYVFGKIIIKSFKSILKSIIKDFHNILLLRLVIDITDSIIADCY